VFAEDPSGSVDLPRVKRWEMDALSVEECRRFLAVAEQSDWYPLFTVALRGSFFGRLRYSVNRPKSALKICEFPAQSAWFPAYIWLLSCVFRMNKEA
jgi:hypothetical protein